MQVIITIADHLCGPPREYSDEELRQLAERVRDLMSARPSCDCSPFWAGILPPAQALEQQSDNVFILC